MSDNAKQDQLDSELNALEQFAESNEILSVERSEDSPRRVRLVFEGVGLGPGDTIDDEVEPHSHHECEVNFPSRYPDEPPQLRWQSKIYHPNLSSSGFVDLEDFGCDWDADPSLTTLCECIWNTVRYARVDLADVKNMSAKGWLDKQTEFELPLDRRELRVSVRPRAENLVHYERRDGGANLTTSAPQPTSSVPVYIGEEVEPEFVQVEIVEPNDVNAPYEINDDVSEAPEIDVTRTSGSASGSASVRENPAGNQPNSDRTRPEERSAKRLPRLGDDLFFIGDEEDG